MFKVRVPPETAFAPHDHFLKPLVQSPTRILIVHNSFLSLQHCPKWKT